jgi:hypothetical protein
MPPGAIYVGRPSRWGNPYPAGAHPSSFGGPSTREVSVHDFGNYAIGRARLQPDWLSPLRGHDLVCWCPLDQPCHADILLELANRDNP